MRSIRLFLFTFSAAAILSGCAIRPSPDRELTGSEWRFQSLDDTAFAQEQGHLRFEDDRISADIGCNQMGGPWHVNGDRLVAGPLVKTEMACLDSDVFAAERGLAALLVAAPNFKLDGDRLTLRSRGHSAILTRVNRPPEDS
ncbi:META domain-containing protein [Altericroceibacterium endophyticum]|uniref:META domain-containing protein n=1 Tax=Altericroceibacterium endophyticum TaxID=1808508 RepID=A0A6I4SZQ8_9SPHN|nr:META domain-containing protein [Altericroceibacterium endophyticum]MXO64208.1 META domain-containing protein [Altericroceibacterium endophyticum]